MKYFINVLFFVICATYYSSFAVICDDSIENIVIKYDESFNSIEIEEAKEVLFYITPNDCYKNLKVLIKRANFNNPDVFKRIRELMCASWEFLTRATPKSFLTQPIVITEKTKWWENLIPYTDQDTLSKTFGLTRYVSLCSYTELRELLKIAMFRNAQNVIRLILSQENLKFLFKDEYYLDSSHKHVVVYPPFEMLASIAEEAVNPLETAHCLYRILINENAEKFRLDIYPIFTKNVNSFCNKKHANEKCEDYCKYLKRIRSLLI